MRPPRNQIVFKEACTRSVSPILDIKMPNHYHKRLIKGAEMWENKIS